MARFFVDLELIVGSEIALPVDVVRHINVLRIRESESIILFNGDGCDYHAYFTLLDKRNCKVCIDGKNIVNNESPLKIILLMAIIANDKFDLIIQKAVELGVSTIVPVYCQNTQRFRGEKLQSKLEHWRKVAISASEQSYRAVICNVAEPQEFTQSLNDYSYISDKYILSPHHVGQFISTSTEKEIVLVVGPEGGFTINEVEMANRLNYQSVVLGNRILRAETAAIAAVTVVQMISGDFN